MLNWLTFREIYKGYQMSVDFDTEFIERVE